MFRTLSFFVLITVIGHQIKADHVSDIYELPQASDEHLAIDMTSSEGMEIKFPFYSSDITSLLPEQRDLILGDTKEMFAFIKEIIADILDNPSSNRISGAMRWVGITKKFVVIAKNQEDNRKKRKIPPVKVRKEYNMNMRDMFRELMQKSQVVEKGLRDTPKDRAGLKLEVNSLIDSILEGLEKSPVVCYVDWTKGKIDNEPFVERAANVMGRLRHNGFGGVLACVDALLTLLTKFAS